MDVVAGVLARERALVAALCRRLLGDAALAEDAAQEAVLRALARPPPAVAPDEVGPLLRAIAVNVCRYWRRQRRRDGRSLDALVEAGGLAEPRAAGEDLADDAAARETAARVRAAVATLPAGQRAAVALHYFAGLSLIEAAVVLGTDPGAVKSRLHKARRNLGARLGPLWEGAPRSGAARASRAAGATPAPRRPELPGLDPLGGKPRWGAPHLRLFRLEVDVEGLTDALLAFVVDHGRTRGDHPAVRELRSAAPGAVPVLETMVLDGVRERRHVAAFLRAVFGAAA
jgi:RNA polymerase sigma factor (sigma-70 family)